jgi:GT2 family glycosyltransferase
MTVAAVVVTYRRPKLLMQCLRALREQTHPVDEIIVVDNASGDGTAERVRQEFPDVTLRVLSENRGGAGGFHEGMRIAAQQDVDWIWVMDDDAEPEPDALEQIAATGLHERADTVGLTSLKRFPNGVPQYDQTGWYRPHQAVIQPVGASEEAVTEVGYSSFVGLLVRADVVDVIGLPDAGFFLWYDDVEYCLRLRTSGRLYLVRDSVITHHVSEDVRGDGDDKPWRHFPTSFFWRFYYSFRNRLLIARRHTATLQEQVRGTAQVLFRAARSAGSVLVYSDDKLPKLALLARGVADGLRGRSGKCVDPADF